ncbi:MAG: hypothetical protein U9R12_06760 [Candidatus Caldatribacteriota bacterium]|nr:hypothetical protein [Candidatus Caldatribacteriota bacterium]
MTAGSVAISGLLLLPLISLGQAYFTPRNAEKFKILNYGFTPLVLTF